jgi:hypothetical protein
MRKNAGMHEGPDDHAASAAALIPIAVVAVAVLLLALLVSGNRTGTIVVERVIWNAVTVQGGQTRRPPPYSLTTITQASADGTVQRSFYSTSVTRPGFQYASAGQTVEFYDAAHNTIYQTTEPALKRLYSEQSRASGGRVAELSAAETYTPDRTSVFEQELRAGLYRVARRVAFDGRPALELVQTHPTRLAVPHDSGQNVSESTVYVGPRTLDPIGEVTREKFAGADVTVISRWRTYRVLDATPAHQWLVSLTARHPGAHIVYGALNYSRGDESGNGTRTTTSDG